MWRWSVCNSRCGQTGAAVEYNFNVKTNVLGAQNVIDASVENKVKKVIALSTDKAAAPINLYGATKLVSDKLFISANNFVGSKDIKFSVVRYGNVAGSRGSVIPFFLKCKKTGLIPITDERMTRFNITLEEGVEFVVKCLSTMDGGELYIPKIPSFRITDLVKALGPKIKTKIIGIRPGEKIHEEMITNSDALNTIEFSDHYIILSNVNSQMKLKIVFKTKTNFKKAKLNGGKIIKNMFSYNSETNKNYMSISELKNLILNLEK